MSLSSRRSFLTVLLGMGGLASLGGCGFAPVYGPDGAGAGLHGAVAIATPEGRDAYALVKRLEERLGQPENARFALSYAITTRREDAGVTADPAISRSQVFGSATFALTDMLADTEIQSGSVTSFVSFSNQGTAVSIATVERDAHRRLMVALADLMVARLIATAPGQSRGQSRGQSPGGSL